jgi:hypothetical protein
MECSHHFRWEEVKDSSLGSDVHNWGATWQLQYRIPYTEYNNCGLEGHQSGEIRVKGRVHFWTARKRDCWHFNANGQKGVFTHCTGGVGMVLLLWWMVLVHAALVVLYGTVSIVNGVGTRCSGGVGMVLLLWWMVLVHTALVVLVWYCYCGEWCWYTLHWWCCLVLLV